MVANLFQPSLARAVDNQGLVAAGAKMFFYLAQSTTFAVQYIDAAGLTPGTNPRVADAYGKFAPVYIDPSLIYRVVLKNNDQSEVFFDVDDIRGYDLGMITDFAAQVALDRVAVSADKALAESAAATALNASSAAISASLASGAYSNAYASTLPKGVTSISITAAGSGYTNGTYALGVSGGPTGFAGTYTVTGNTVTSVTITNPGLATATTAPTLSFPSGGGTGATATATVASLIADQKTYWAASSDGYTNLLYRNNGGSVAAVNNPDGTQINTVQRGLIDQTLQATSPFNAAFLVANPHVYRIRSVKLNDPTRKIGLQYWVRDTSGTRLIGRFVDITTSEVIYVGVYGGNPDPTTDSAMGGGTNRQLVNLYDSSGVCGAIDIDFGTGGNFGTTTAFTPANARLAQSALGYTASEITQFNSTFAKRTDTDVFLPSVTDTYMRSLVVEAHVENADPGKTYVLNYETIYFAGVPLYRVKFELRDTQRGAVVAKWTQAAATDFTTTQSQTVFLASAVQGDVYPGIDYTGISCTLWIDWSKIDWSKNLTTYTTAAQAGINPKHNFTSDMLDDWLTTPKHRKHIRVGTGLDYTTVLAAFRSLQYDPASQPLRSDWPLGDIATPSNPVLIEVCQAAYSEAIGATTTISGDQSTIVWPSYVTLRLRPDTYLYMASDSNTAPVFEAHHHFRVELNGGKIEQLGSTGYVFHVDAQNVLFKRAVSGAPTQHHKRRYYIGGGNLKSSAASWMIGEGTSNNSLGIVENVLFERTATTGYAYHGMHTSPNTVDPGVLIHRNNISNDALYSDPAIECITSHATSVKHLVAVDSCDYGKIKASYSTGGLTNHAYRRSGKFVGLTGTSSASPANGQYSNVLDPL